MSSKCLLLNCSLSFLKKGKPISSLCLMRSQLLDLMAYSHRLSMCNHLLTAGTVTHFHAAPTLPIFHDEFPRSWNVLPTKDILFRVLQHSSMFTDDALFFVVWCVNDCHYPSEIATIGTLLSAKTSHLLCNTVICGRASGTCFVNALCVNTTLKIHKRVIQKQLLMRRSMKYITHNIWK